MLVSDINPVSLAHNDSMLRGRRDEKMGHFGLDFLIPFFALRFNTLSLNSNQVIQAD